LEDDKRLSSFTTSFIDSTEFRTQLCSQLIENAAGSLNVKYRFDKNLFYFIRLLLLVATSLWTITAHHGTTANFDQRAAQEEAPSLQFSSGRYSTGS
jgi:hypothetical protein